MNLESNSDMDYIDRIDKLRAERDRLRAALLALANAADVVGVQFFDTDTMEPEVEAMQTATQAARAALT